MQAADVIHFALHANASTESLDAPHLVLFPDEDSLPDRYLFDYEIESLDLNSKLVVLNTCESGEGRLYDGEGLFSISRGFVLGGADAVLHTQWPIDDRIGKNMILSFYKALERGESKSKALRKAQRAYLESAYPHFRHPYYWAAYQVLGDDSPLFVPWPVYGSVGGGLLAMVGLWMVLRRRKTAG
ncbi:MAG: CHAT domain-containing protein [Bacteroidales bacterium]